MEDIEFMRDVEVGDFILYPERDLDGWAIYEIIGLPPHNNRMAMQLYAVKSGKAHHWMSNAGMGFIDEDGDWTKISKEEAEIMKIMES